MIDRSPDKEQQNVDLPESHRELYLADQLAFTGRSDEAPQFQASFERYRESKRNTQLSGEIEKTPEQKSKIQTIHYAMLEIGEENGIDLYSRLPNIREYHFFPDEASYVRALKEVGDRSISLEDGWIPPARARLEGIMQIKPDESVSDTVHETWHDVSKQWVNLEEYSYDGQGRLQIESVGLGSGFSYMGEAASMEEWATDLACIQTMERAGYEPRAAYLSLDILGASLIHEVADHHGVSAEAAYGIMLNDKINGTGEWIDLLHTAFGEEDYNRIINFLADSRPADVLQLAQALDLDEAVQGIEIRIKENREPPFRKPWRTEQAL